MTTRARWRIVASFAIVATLVGAAACGDDDDDDDCITCCECSNLGSPLVYRPEAIDDCKTCAQQCQDLADHEFLGQPFDNAKKISCE